ARITGNIAGGFGVDPGQLRRRLDLAGNLHGKVAGVPVLDIADSGFTGQHTLPGFIYGVCKWCDGANTSDDDSAAPCLSRLPVLHALILLSPRSVMPLECGDGTRRSGLKIGTLWHSCRA